MGTYTEAMSKVRKAEARMEYKGKKHSKPEVKGTKMSRDGKLKIGFDHIMKVPDFVQNGQRRRLNMTHHMGRKLIALNELDVTRDLLELNFIMKSDVDPNDIGYSIILNEWTPSTFDVSVNITTPLLISKGLYRDTLYVKIKDPSLFVSSESGEPLNIAGKVIMKQTLPR